MTRDGLDIVVLGLSLSSSWGNGHATTFRALLGAMSRRGHRIRFLERDRPWYAAHRDLPVADFCELNLYEGLDGLAAWQDAIGAADAVIVGSYVPDGVAVGEMVQRLAGGVTAFYDIDTPVTLAKLVRGDDEYLTAALIPGFDLYLSFSGGPTLDVLSRRYGSPAARAFYCSVDPELYRPVETKPRWDLSYLGTYSTDRQPTLDRLLLQAARNAPDLHFAVAGPQYPDDIVWPANVERLDHVAPADHAEFYGASRYTLNVTRVDMIAAGYSPSVRLFEAAACGTPVISDYWEGIDTLLDPRSEITVAENVESVLRVLRFRAEAERRGGAAAARRRILAEHTAAHRASELEAHLLEAADRKWSATSAIKFVHEDAHEER